VQLTTDHSYVQMLLASGAIEAEEAENHPNKNIITQCLGSDELGEVRVDTVRGEWQKDQWILLCSDGLTDEVDDKGIAQILCDSQSTQEGVNRLMQAALNHGGRDNITLQHIQSPLTRGPRMTGFSQWLPAITGKRTWDLVLCCVALASLTLMLYWTLR
jgi:protein phosphatase